MAVAEVYVLGAGASYVHGAPLTDQLLPYALTKLPDRNHPRLALLRRFLKQVFHFTTPRTSHAIAWQGVPSLVDVLSMVDVALDRKESLAIGFDVEELRRVRTALEFAIFRALEDSLRGGKLRAGQRHSRATQQLADRLDAEKAAVISLNYDVIADIAVAMRGRNFAFDRADMETLSGGNHQAVDYGVEFANVAPPAAGEQRFQLLKLHGSFNWFRSRLTGNLYFGGMQKAVGVLFRDRPERAVGNLWRFFGQKTSTGPIAEEIDDLEPVLITPTHLKDLRNPHVARIWRRAEECLRGARRITFIGYSLPGDDLHVKYLLKRSLSTRRPGALPPEIVVVDRGNARTSPVRHNYERFFGKSSVQFYGEGFNQWVRGVRARIAH